MAECAERLESATKLKSASRICDIFRKCDNKTEQQSEEASNGAEENAITTDNEGTVVYSYVWFHKKGTELEANNETCKLIED